MKFSISSKLFYNYLSGVGKIISSKNAVTILNNFLMILEGDILTIVAGDMENTVEARVAVGEAEGSGSFCIDARRMTDLLKDIPEQGITFELDPDTMNVTINFSQGKYDIVAIDANEYPRQVTSDGEQPLASFSAPSSRISKAIDGTIFAVSTDMLRPMMTGIFWDIKPDFVTFVATDTRVLVRYTDTEIKPGCTASFILPLKTASVFKNAFFKDETVTVTVGEKNVTFHSESFTLISVLIKGNFPDYNRVIPANNPYTLTAERAPFYNAVRRMNSFVQGESSLIKFSISPDMMTITSDDRDVCVSARENLMCSFTGDRLTIGFNANYLVNILNSFSSQEVVIALSDPSRPGVFTPGEKTDGLDLLMLLMPMNMQ